MKIKISEIFYSIQGEGPNLGKPSVFIRFFGCNLQCHFCDTKFTWHPDHADFTEMTPEEISQKISKLVGANNHSPELLHLIFTGGEPSLFQKEIKAIKTTLEASLPSGGIKGALTLEIETNGSFPLEENLYHTINISPKLPSSGNKTYAIKTLNNFTKKLNASIPPLPEGEAGRGVKITYKFVADTTPESQQEILEFIHKNKIPQEKIYIMPEAQTYQEIKEKSHEILEFCKTHHFHFTPRLHIWLYSDKKGV